MSKYKERISALKEEIIIVVKALPVDNDPLKEEIICLIDSAPDGTSEQVLVEVLHLLYQGFDLQTVLNCKFIGKENKDVKETEDLFKKLSVMSKDITSYLAQTTKNGKN